MRIGEVAEHAMVLPGADRARWSGDCGRMRAEVLWPRAMMIPLTATQDSGKRGLPSHPRPDRD